MRDVVGIVWHADVVLVTLDAPPANAFGPELRRAILAALVAQPAPPAMVIASALPAFSAALPLDGDAATPRLTDLCAAILRADFPVIVAVAGAAMGPGFELALAADKIVASPQATFSLPEIALGLLPGGGATQLLPRRVGAKAALNMILTGRVVAVDEALRIGLVDLIVDTDPVAAALILAADMANAARPARPVTGLRADAHAAAIATARADLFIDALPAMASAIDAVEAALLLPLEQGLVFETTLRDDLLRSDEVAGLRSAAESARMARRQPKVLAGKTPAPVAHLYLEGSGPDMAAIAFAAISAGIRVTLAEADRAVLGSVLKLIAERQDAAVSAGRLDVAARDGDWARLATLTPGALLPDAVDAVVLGPDTAARQPVVQACLAATVPCMVLGGTEGVLGLSLAPSGRITTLSGVTATDSAATARALLQRIGLPCVITGGSGPSPGDVLVKAGATALARMQSRGVRHDALVAALRSVQAVVPVLPAAPFDPRVNGGQPLAMPRPEIIARWWGAMAAAGLDCLAAGSALCPADIDHLMCSGHGFPRRLGGPMHLAGRRGLLLLRQDLRVWARDDRVWAAPPMLDRLLGDGRTLASLNPG